MGDDGFPRTVHADERELYLDWIRWLRSAVVRKVDGVSEADGHRRPDGRLISLVGIVNHLTRMEWRWIDGGFRGATTERTDEEFAPGPELTVGAALEAYRERAAATDAFVRATPLTTSCAWDGANLRWVLVHIINETARHAGHADATRELIDGVTGE